MGRAPGARLGRAGSTPHNASAASWPGWWARRRRWRWQFDLGQPVQAGPGGRLLARPERRVILTDDLNFPSDLYILESAARLVGGSVRVVASADGIFGPVAALAAALGDDTALLNLSHRLQERLYVRHGRPDRRRPSRRGHGLWDLSHSAGSVVVDLNSAAADLAVGCTYKYLNGGPGAPAFLYVRRDLQEALRNPISGWIDRRDPFDFALDYAPAPASAAF